MIILNIDNNEIKRKRMYIFRKKTEKPEEIIRRSRFICRGIIFNVVSVSKKHILSGELDNYLKRFKGEILKTNDDEVNNYLCDLLFDTSEYLKKAYLSQLKKIIRKLKMASLCIYDDYFELHSELYNIAELCKNITIYTHELKKVTLFSDECFLKYGINIFINESFALNNETVFVDFNGINDNKAIFTVINGEQTQLIPDISYFTPDDNTKLLSSYGVPIKTSCALFKDKIT